MKSVKKAISFGVIMSLFFSAIFVFFEPAAVEGVEDPVSVTLTITAEISITTAQDIPLADIAGLVGGTSASSTTWNVKTNNATGYNIGLKSSTQPAMTASSTSIELADYTAAATPSPDFTWTLGTAVAEFGYAPYNLTSSVARYKNDAADCNSGTTVTELKCWDAFSSSSVVVANCSAKTASSGEDTKVNVQAQYDILNGTQQSGVYTATITATAVVN